MKPMTMTANDRKECISPQSEVQLASEENRSTNPSSQPVMMINFCRNDFVIVQQIKNNASQ